MFVYAVYLFIQSINSSYFIIIFINITKRKFFVFWHNFHFVILLRYFTFYISYKHSQTKTRQQSSFLFLTLIHLSSDVEQRTNKTIVHFTHLGSRHIHKEIMCVQHERDYNYVKQA